MNMMSGLKADPYYQSAVDLLGRYPDLSKEELDQLISLYPQLSPVELAMMISNEEIAGKLDAFNRALEVDRIPILTTMLAHTHAIAGDRDTALKLLDDLMNTARKRYISPYDIAVVHAGLGDRQAALEHLQAALDERSPWMVFVTVDPRLDGLREEPAFARITAALA